MCVFLDERWDASNYVPVTHKTVQINAFYSGQGALHRLTGGQKGEQYHRDRSRIAHEVGPITEFGTSGVYRCRWLTATRPIRDHLHTKGLSTVCHQITGNVRSQ